MPAFYFDTDPYIRGTVMANYTSGAPVVGNLTLKATFRQIKYNQIKTGIKEGLIERNLTFVRLIFLVHCWNFRRFSHFRSLCPSFPITERSSGRMVRPAYLRRIQRVPRCNFPSLFGSAFFVICLTWISFPISSEVSISSSTRWPSYRRWCPNWTA